MKVTLTALLILCASMTASYADYIAAILTMQPLTTSCTGGTPLPRTTIGRIYWDQDSDGPDATDPQPCVPYGPGCASINSFPFNGWDYIGAEGTFWTDPLFRIPNNYPPPRTFYVRVDADSIQWTSQTFSLRYSYQEFNLAGRWTCAPLVVPCENYFTIGYENLNQDPEDHRHLTYSTCIELCANQTAYLHGFDFPLSGGGYATLNPGCGTESPCNSDEGLPYAYPLWENGTNTVALHEYSWDAWIPLVSPVAGWACLYIDIILPVEQGNFEAAAGDGRVVLNWNTLSETGVENFAVLRKIDDTYYDIIGMVPAENSPSGAHYSFTDQTAVNDVTYHYSLLTINLDGSRQEWGVEESATPRADIVSEFALHQNYPNPFNPETTIKFELATDAIVSLNVYNLSGQVVAELVNGVFRSGSHSVSFDGSTLSAGVYFYTIRIGNQFTATRKMLLLK